VGQTSSKKIAVIDPALMAAGGHHAGFAAMAASALPLQAGLEVEFVCHVNIDEAIKAQLVQAHCVVSAEFTINYYEYFDQPVSVADIQPYVLSMTKEYIAVIQRLIRYHVGSEILFFHPSLSWEHAYCLALALTHLGPMPSATHIVCAMFNPAIDYRGKTTDCSKKFNYALAFKRLNKIETVKLYASDQELSWAYSKLLEQTKPLPIHPCYLTDWLGLNGSGSTNKAQGEVLRVTLYMGDAKENKGFLLLPELAKKILADKALNIELSIQYTLTWASSAVKKTAEEIALLAKGDKRLLLTEHFLLDNEMQNHLEQIDLFVFTYESEAYQDKNSGLLWLIGWYSTPVYFLSLSWLSREALRLELPVLKATDGLNNLIEKINHLKNDTAENKKTETKNKLNPYRAEIYRPFWNWIAHL
jgi:hypothetical protein